MSNNLKLAIRYDELHKELGELTFWTMDAETAIREGLKTLAENPRMDKDEQAELKRSVNEVAQQLIEWKEQTFEVIYKLYRLEAQMDAVVNNPTNPDLN